MIEEDLKKSVKNLKLSEDAKERITNNCHLKLYEGEEKFMKKSFTFKKFVPAMIILLICAVSVGAVVGHIRGFRDIKKGTAIVGLEFDEQTEMIDVSCEKQEDMLVLNVSVQDFNNPPYSEAEVFELTNYLIVDPSEEIVHKGQATPSVNGFVEGKAEFEIPIENIDNGDYKLVINGFVISKKADAPLYVNGVWECSFTK